MGVNIPILSSYNPNIFGLSDSFSPNVVFGIGGEFGSEAVALVRFILSSPLLSTYTFSLESFSCKVASVSIPRLITSVSALVISDRASLVFDNAFDNMRSDNNSLSVMCLGDPFFWCSIQIIRRVHLSSLMSSICSSNGPNTGLGTGVKRTLRGKLKKRILSEFPGVGGFLQALEPNHVVTEI